MDGFVIRQLVIVLPATSFSYVLLRLREDKGFNASAPYEDYKVAASLLGITQYFKFNQNVIKCLYNGAKIDFSGLDEVLKRLRVSVTTKGYSLRSCQSLSMRT